MVEDVVAVAAGILERSARMDIAEKSRDSYIARAISMTVAVSRDRLQSNCLEGFPTISRNYGNPVPSESMNASFVQQRRVRHVPRHGETASTPQADSSGRGGMMFTVFGSPCCTSAVSVEVLAYPT